MYRFSSLCGCSSEGKSSAGSNETDSNVLAAIHDHASLVRWRRGEAFQDATKLPRVEGRTLCLGFLTCPLVYSFQLPLPFQLPLFITTLTSSGLIRSGTVQPSRSYSAMHCSAKPLYFADWPIKSATIKTSKRILS